MGTSLNNLGDSYELLRKAMVEVEGVFTPSTFDQLEKLIKNLSESNKIVCYGVGREGLVMKSLTMRLMHCGLKSYFVGDMNTPYLGEGDLLLVSAGPGYFSTVNALVEVAAKSNAKSIVFTAQPKSLNSNNYQEIIHIPATTMADDQAKVDAVLPMGSLYEIALFLFFEIVILKLRDFLGEDSESMRKRHTNLE